MPFLVALPDRMLAHQRIAEEFRVLVVVSGTWCLYPGLLTVYIKYYLAVLTINRAFEDINAWIILLC